jgi:hypothetical protein
MKKEIGWVEKTPEGKREVTVKLFGGKVFWAWRMEGDEDWDEKVTPDPEQWETLERLYRNRLGRGTGTVAELDCIVARIQGQVRGKPRQSDPAPSKKPGNAA